MWIDTVITVMAVLVGSILLLNLYFRVQVLRKFRVLVENRVQIGKEHFFNVKKLREEVLPRHPEQRQAILVFVNYIRYSVFCNAALVTAITVLAAILIFGKPYYS